MKEWNTLGATAAIFIAAAVIIMGLLALSGAFGERETEAVAPETEIPISPEIPEKTIRLGVFEGRLALFRGESGYPNEIYDILIRSLPEADRLRLENGVAVKDEDELKKLLEDYMS